MPLHEKFYTTKKIYNHKNNRRVHIPISLKFEKYIVLNLLQFFE